MGGEGGGEGRGGEEEERGGVRRGEEGRGIGVESKSNSVHYNTKITFLYSK